MELHEESLQSLVPNDSSTPIDIMQSISNYVPLAGLKLGQQINLFVHKSILTLIFNK